MTKPIVRREQLALVEHRHPTVIADDRDLTHAHDGGGLPHAHATYGYAEAKEQ